jgi:hypothetical protein
MALVVGSFARWCLGISLWTIVPGMMDFNGHQLRLRDFDGHDICSDLMLVCVPKIRRSVFRSCWVHFEPCICSFLVLLMAMVKYKIVWC